MPAITIPSWSSRSTVAPSQTGEVQLEDQNGWKIWLKNYILEKTARSHDERDLEDIKLVKIALTGKETTLKTNEETPKTSKGSTQKSESNARSEKNYCLTYGPRSKSRELQKSSRSLWQKQRVTRLEWPLSCLTRRRPNSKWRGVIRWSRPDRRRMTPAN